MKWRNTMAGTIFYVLLAFFLGFCWCFNFINISDPRGCKSVTTADHPTLVTFRSTYVCLTKLIMIVFPILFFVLIIPRVPEYIGLGFAGDLAGFVAGNLFLSMVFHRCRRQVAAAPAPGATYLFIAESKTFDEHERDAQARGGHITSCASAAELNHLKTLTGNRTVWIGGKRIGRGNGPGANHWEWADGTRWHFHNWFLGEPNNAGGSENRVHMYADGGWNDIPAGWRGPAIYKFQGEPRPPPAQSSLRPDVEEAGTVAIAAPVEIELPIVTAIIVDSMPPDGSVAELIEGIPVTVP